MDWALRFDPGQVRAACSICGCSRRFPDNLTYCVDKLFRCERCMEITALERDMQIQSYRMQPDEPEVSIGLTPQANIPSTFLADAIEYRNAVLPGWTPTNEFQDDFTIIPGGVGSSWAVVASGTGAAVSQPEAGVARFDSGSGSVSFARATRFGFAVPAPGTGFFFCAARFRTPVISATGTAVVGVGDAGTVQRNFVGLRGVSTSPSGYYQLVAQALEHDVSQSPTDTSGWHFGVMWWKSGSRAMGAIDGTSQLNVRSAGTNGRSPFLLAATSSAAERIVLDVTDWVCWT